MQLFEVKSDIAKIVYNPAENHLLPSDFMLIEDVNQKLIAQIINIETTDNSNNNLAVLRLALSIDKEDNLSLFNGYIPAKNSKIIYINPDEIMELIKGSDINIYFGNLANHSSCFVKPSISFLNDKLYIQSDRDDKTEIIFRNIITELQNKNKNTILLDFDGRYSDLNNSVLLKITDNFKLPLNIEAFNTILENDVSDCPIEDRAVIQSIILELRGYLQTLQDKYLPFTGFKNVVDDEFLSNPVSGLMLFRNKLWMYAQDNIFAENKNQFDILNNLFDSTNTIVIDASLIDKKWYRFVIQTILTLLNKSCYFLLSVNDVVMDKKAITSLYNKFAVVPIVSSSYDYISANLFKSVCKNQVLCKPSKYFNEDEKYAVLLNKINDSEMILYGETTLYLPLIVEMQPFTPLTADEILNNEIKKDVDKLLSSPQTVISPENLVADIAKDNDDNFEIIEEDDLTDSDLDFLDEQNALEEGINTAQNEESLHYSLFSPVEVEKQKETVIAKDDNTHPSAENVIAPEDNNDLSVNDNTDIIASDNTTGDLSDLVPDLVESAPVDSEQSEISKENVPENIVIGTDETDLEDIEDIEELAMSESLPDEDILDTEEDEEIAPLDDVIQEITDKLDSGEANKTDSVNDKEDVLDVELESDDEEEPPPVNENINIKKSPELPVYETDRSSSELTENIPFKIGDTVYHPKHGKGVIEGFANYSNKILFCQIDFENVGRRILDPRIAGIEKVS